MHFSRSIAQYRSLCRFHRQMRTFICYFVIWHDFSGLQWLGTLSKIRYYVDINVLSYLYYALIYPFLIYGIIAWGNTYSTTLQPLFILQKRAIRFMTFTIFYEHLSPIFRKLNIIKLDDLISYHIAVFMYRFNNSLLPSAFDAFFSKVSEIHYYNTRSAAKRLY